MADRKHWFVVVDLDSGEVYAPDSLKAGEVLNVGAWTMADRLKMRNALMVLEEKLRA